MMRLRKRSACALVLLAVSTVITACSLINRARGITENYRNDGLGALRVRVLGAMCCTTSTGMVAPPAESVLVVIRGPGRGPAADSLGMLTDVSGEALFEGIDPGSYDLIIKSVRFLIPYRQSVRIRTNARLDVTYNLNNTGYSGKNPFRSGSR